MRAPRAVACRRPHRPVLCLPIPHKGSIPPLCFSRPGRQASIRTRLRPVAAVLTGVLKFQGCCYLSIDLWEKGRLSPTITRDPAVTPTRRLRKFAESVLVLVLSRRYPRIPSRPLRRLSVIQRIVNFSVHPQAMQQPRQFSRHRYHNAPFAVLAPTLQLA